MKNLTQFFRENQEVDIFLISKPENIFYLTGFQGSFSYFLSLKNGQNFLITDSRYAEIAENLAKKNSFFEFLLFEHNFKNNLLKTLNFPNQKVKIAIENSSTLAQQNFWQEIFPSAEFLPQKKIIEEWRSIKNTNELQKIKKACDKVNNIFDNQQFFREILREGITEKEVAFTLEMELREKGKYDLSFPIIVAFGENSAIPHHSPSNRELKFGENILIDCGVKFENYCSDITRNLFFGKPSSDFCNTFAKLLEVQKNTIDKFVVGNSLHEADNFCRQELGNFAKNFTHSLGHGVGLEVHEKPNFSREKNNIFQENQVITCEPGLYFSGKFGIRIEDQILITTQKPEILTKTSKELIII